MESQWQENSLSDLKMLIKELNCGQEFTHKLRDVIKQSLVNGDMNMLAENLVGQIMGSFCKTLSILNTSNSNEDSQIPMVAVFPCPKDGRTSPEDSTGSCKKSSAKDRIGCNKKRKISAKTVKETSTLADDGHVWRKYGQKQILDAPYPRHYYRCTNKFDQGCEAIKQVQRIQDNPPQFRTIYQGHHTCTTYPTASQILLDSSTDYENSSILLSFNTKDNHYYHPYNFPTFFSTKKETKEENSPSFFYPNNNQNQISTSDYILPANDYWTPATETSGNVMATALSSASDNVDYISSESVTSTHNLEMEMEMEMEMMAGIDFDDLPFEF
ncbi:putative WRKY transcription factor 70 [Nicotiana tabacum]|uniref:WRKY transcription factor 70 n=2 Tax=Nicotiana TaxID=4085 RepID=A0A1S4AUY5_TOBAC|nr:PREDICTED: probable WRKY transcription factor 70 [Nicotiana sylvestris]XP_016480542.1 PREDICTED: probable WRKY transcription factor 70 [Nicotiana tabacum]